MPIKKTKISYEMKLKLKTKNKKKRTEIKNIVSDFVLNEIEQQTLKGISPVDGQPYPDYKNKSYEKLKKKITGSSKPNLHLKNEMISSIIPEFKDDSIIFKITERKQKLKAYNHNVGDTVRKRKFIPNESGRGAGFSEDIKEGVKEIIRQYDKD